MKRRPNGKRRTYRRALGHVGPGRAGTDGLEAQGRSHAGDSGTAGRDSQSGEHCEREIEVEVEVEVGTGDEGQKKNCGVWGRATKRDGKRNSH